MRLTRPGARQTPSGRRPARSAKAAVTAATRSIVAAVCRRPRGASLASAAQRSRTTAGVGQGPHARRSPAEAGRAGRAPAAAARAGAVRGSNSRGNTAHIEAWAVTAAAVVLASHNSASRLAWRTHHAASFEGLDPVSGKVLWTRHIYNLLGERPGDYAPTLASPSANVVYARTEFGVPNGVDTRTGQTLWEHPGLDGCRTDQIVAGPAGVAISQRCPDGKERLALLDPRSGNTLWKNEFSTPQLRLLAVGTNSVA